MSPLFSLHDFHLSYLDVVNPQICGVFYFFISDCGHFRGGRQNNSTSYHIHQTVNTCKNVALVKIAADK